MAEFNVVDISEHDGLVDFEALRDEGFFAIIRIGYGQDLQSQDDKQAARNIAECERLGIPYGFYLYSYASRFEQVAGEAAHLLRWCEGRRPVLGCFYDIEESDKMDGAGLRAAEWLRIVEAAGWFAGVYASESILMEHLGDVPARKCWVASWGGSKPSGVCAWQFTDAFCVAGGTFDASIYFRDFRESTEPRGDVDSLACRVIAGDFGNGEDRRRALGSEYEVVQFIVNRILGCPTDPRWLASRVIAGDFGNGEDRRRALGSAYDEVQVEVNKILGF